MLCSVCQDHILNYARSCERTFQPYKSAAARVQNHVELRQNDKPDMFSQKIEFNPNQPYLYTHFRIEGVRIQSVPAFGFADDSFD
jgi:hypothetical protein